MLFDPFLSVFVGGIWATRLAVPSWSPGNWKSIAVFKVHQGSLFFTFYKLSLPVLEITPCEACNLQRVDLPLLLEKRYQQGHKNRDDFTVRSPAHKQRLEPIIPRISTTSLILDTRIADRQVHRSCPTCPQWLQKGDSHRSRHESKRVDSQPSQKYRFELCEFRGEVVYSYDGDG